MPISESQLNTWSHQGSIVNSSNTANSVKNAINTYTGFPKEIKFDVYLSGSYKNDTNIYGESDVDVVVQLTSSFYNNLTEEQKAHLNLRSTSYGYFDFKKDVIDCLVTYYGSQYIVVGNKAIQILPTHGNKLHADVLVCSSYRKYYNAANESGFNGGIAFYTEQESRRIINYPRQHSDNDTVKHQNTNGWFKPTIRILKNIKTTLIAEGLLQKATAPSYFIECLLSNVPNEHFGTNYQTTVYNVLRYLETNNWNNFQCVNRLIPLWGNTAETWNLPDAEAFYQAVKYKWNNSNRVFGIGF